MQTYHFTHMICWFVFVRMTCWFVFMRMTCWFVFMHMTCWFVVTHMTCWFVFMHMTCWFVFMHMICWFVFTLVDLQEPQACQHASRATDTNKTNEGIPHQMSSFWRYDSECLAFVYRALKEFCCALESLCGALLVVCGHMMRDEGPRYCCVLVSLFQACIALVVCLLAYQPSRGNPWSPPRGMWCHACSSGRVLRLECFCDCAESCRCP